MLEKLKSVKSSFFTVDIDKKVIDKRNPKVS
ncbi:hypothetical protein BJV92_004164 [Clostridium beijerinckii]|nr:hypothetical protein [Clostridium beijerinckii]NRU48351.1 hypothetical protein [Clostridium beijerinckii]NRZ33645.1 hypothetical protein [Clostridium beijerinckii]NSA12857.1 hypothetical protein [Clostridium beijerinckii]NSA62675.1 hypothetical protein [Clostridium beijerinckii]